MENPINLLRRCGQYIVKFIVIATLKISIKGKENIPDAPGALIVANHASYIDVLVLGYPFFRQGLKTRWVISQSNYRIWYLKWLYFLWRVIPVNGTVEKIKQALRQNLWVIIFPEGNERWCPPDKPVKKRPCHGAAAIALSTGVTIIPVGIIGADKVLPARAFKFNRSREITINIGKPFSYKIAGQEKIGDELLNSTTDDIMARIKALTGE